MSQTTNYPWAITSQSCIGTLKEMTDYWLAQNAKRAAAKKAEEEEKAKAAKKLEEEEEKKKIVMEEVKFRMLSAFEKDMYDCDITRYDLSVCQTVAEELRANGLSVDIIRYQCGLSIMKIYINQLKMIL